MAGTVCALYAVFVKRDRSWLTLVGLAGIVFAMTPPGALVFVIAAVVIGMNVARTRSQPVRAPSRLPASPAVRLEGGLAVVVIIAAHVVAAALALVLMYASGSGLLDLATLVGATAAFVGVWWRRRAHPYQAALLAWLVPAAIVGLIVIADSFGLLGA